MGNRQMRRILNQAANAAGLTAIGIKAGLKLRSPMLAAFAWTYYLTEEEKRKTRTAARS
jgi:hypothetical protein